MKKCIKRNYSLLDFVYITNLTYNITPGRSLVSQYIATVLDYHTYNLITII